jgi:hypothetical protein
MEFAGETELPVCGGQKNSAKEEDARTSSEKSKLTAFFGGITIYVDRPFLGWDFGSTVSAPTHMDRTDGSESRSW